VPKQKTDVICILADALPSFPQGIQGYVNRYFEKTSFLNHVYFTASFAVSYDYSKNRNVRGVAPMFLENVSLYKEGVPSGCSPYSWLQARLADSVQQEIVAISHAWEPDSSEENND
jgi:hypothetical protein